MTDFFDDLRATLGDSSATRFTVGRLTSVVYKALNKLNRRYALNKATYYMKIEANKVKYDLPSDCLGVLRYTWRGVELPADSISNDHDLFAEGSNKPAKVLYDRTNASSFILSPRLEEPSMDYVIVDDTSTVVEPDFNTADAVIYKNNIYYLFYNNSALVIPDTAATTDSFDVIEIQYIKKYTRSPNLSDVDLNDNFYDALLYLSASILLSDDNRNEVRQKSAEFYQRYMEALKDASHDSMSSFNPASLEIPYRTIYNA